MRTFFVTAMSWACLPLVALAGTAANVQVERLTITNPAASAEQAGPHLMAELVIEAPGLVGLAESARLTNATDDMGTELLEADGPFDDDFSESGYFMRHQVTTRMEEGWLRVPVFLPSIPHPDATRLTLDFALDLRLREADVRTVLVENVDFSDVPGWGVDVDVAGARMTCRDERRARPQDQPLELNCFMREGSLLDVRPRHDSGNAVPTHPRSNLVIGGARDAVDLEVSLPLTRVEHVPVTLEFGLGLVASAP
jgi:hypothetical protein